MLVPILSAEPDRFPQNLFAPSSELLSSDDVSFWVLHTKPRQEKSLARHLLTNEVPFYLPTVPRRNRIRGRVLTSHVPLFTSYMFLFGDSEARIRALESNRIVNCVPVVQRERLCKDLKQIEMLLATGATVTPEARITVGAPVEIIKGPMAGLTGVVVRSASGSRFIVSIDFIQMGASVLVDDFALAPLDLDRTVA